MTGFFSRLEAKLFPTTRPPQSRALVPAPQPPVLREEWRYNSMRRVIIESPFGQHNLPEHEFHANVFYARECCKDAVNRGEVPFASHLFFPQFLSDKDPAERDQGIEMGYDFWDKADLIVFYMDRGLSPGMERALARAFKEGKPFERRLLPNYVAPKPADYAPPPTREALVNMDALKEKLSAQAKA